MNHSEIKEELKIIEHNINDTERLIKQLKQENALGSILKTQKECNNYMLERFEHNMKMYMKRKGRMLLLLEQPEEEPSVSFINAPHVYLEA